MTSALDNLIAAALKSDNANIRALADAAQAERSRGRGRPSKLSTDDAGAMFIVFCGIYAQHYTGEIMLWQGADQYGKPIVDPEWPDGEPVGITNPMIDTTEAIAHELMAYARCSINTARKFGKKQIAVLAAALEAEMVAKGRRINNMRDGITRAQIAALKAAKKDHTNN